MYFYFCPGHLLQILVHDLSDMEEKEKDGDEGDANSDVDAGRDNGKDDDDGRWRR